MEFSKIGPTFGLGLFVIRHVSNPSRTYLVSHQGLHGFLGCRHLGQQGFGDGGFGRQGTLSYFFSGLRGAGAYAGLHSQSFNRFLSEKRDRSSILP